MVKRVMCDSMIYDEVVKDPGLKQLIEQSVAAGYIVFKTTRVQQSQLAESPIAKNIGQATALNAARLGVSMFFCGWSRLGEDRLAGPVVRSAFAALRGDNPKHSPDALIGITAFTHADILVTNDRQFRNRFKQLNTSVRAMSSDEGLCSSDI